MSKDKISKGKIDILYNYLKNNVAKQYPVLNEELAQSMDYIKNGYLKMLAVVMQQGDITTKAQLEMFKRILEGAESEDKAEDYLCMAWEIEVQDYIDFTRECKKLNIKYRWVLDAIILTCIQERKQEQLELIAHFCESYEISKEELQYIAAMAHAIVSVDMSAYVTAEELKVDTVPDETFSGYRYLISKKCVYANENLTIFSPTCEEDITIENMEMITETETPCIKIVDATISVADYRLVIADKEKVIFENCTFTGGKNYAIHIEDCDQLIIRNCKFHDFSTRTLIIDGYMEYALIKNCEFSNCKKNCDTYNSFDNGFGGVIYSEYINLIDKFEISNSSFINCGGMSGISCANVTPIISNIKTNVSQCKFEHCWFVYTFTNRYKDGNNMRMFQEESNAINCEYIDSAKFC